jgi:hypothetical protein
LTASTVLQMYLQGREGGDELIMLSELQVLVQSWAVVAS